MVTSHFQKSKIFQCLYMLVPLLRFLGRGTMRKRASKKALILMRVCDQPQTLNHSSSLLLQVTDEGIEVVQALEPFLHHKVLRRIVTSFSNSADGDGKIGSWACNPRVQVTDHRGDASF